MFGVAGYLYYDIYIVPRCEICGMSTIYGYREITTPDGCHHVACCPFCALLLVQKYPTFKIETKCDACGRKIVIEIENKQLKRVDPPTAYLIIGGTGLCKDNKMACCEECKEKLLAQAPPGSAAFPMEEAVRIAAHPVRKAWIWTPSPVPIIATAFLGGVSLALAFLMGRKR